MRFLYTIGLISLFLTAVLWPTISQATHVRAGEITTRRISATSLTYEITLTTYYDEENGRPASNDANEYTFCFGDGTTQVVSRGNNRRDIPGRRTSINIYRTVHTYPGPGAYTIGVQIPNRNKNTKNLPPPGSSDSIVFWVSSTISIDQNLGLNSSPVMLNPPLDSARVGQRFCHNPVAFDIDRDSLAYRLSVPAEGLQNRGICANRLIPAYQDPTRFSRISETGGAPTFTINPQTGELCWDAPGEEGQYNFAFIVEEWRNGILIGEITRDMQIYVVDQPNKRPLIEPLPDLCVEAGTTVNQVVRASDPDGNRVIITAYGGIFNLSPDGLPLPAGELIPPAYARLVNGGVAQNQPGTATLTWQTNCNQISDRPYEVVYKVSDVPARGNATLVSFQTQRIRIIGPAVKNLTARPTATANGRAIQLSWAPYNCGPAGSQLIIYRREGCDPITINACTTGLPAGSGYREVISLPLNATTYTDTSALRRGVNYSYRILARYGDRNQIAGVDPLYSNGGFSVASEQACLELPLLAPVMTQVTVDSTAERGRITVRWTRPIGLQPGDLGSPYQYRLQRATGLDGTNFETVATINTTLQPGAPDTVYIDRGTTATTLNTVANAYRYRVEFYYTDNATRQLTRLDITEPASSVRLTATPAQRQVLVRWQANTPWSNDNRVHDLYRSRTGPNGPFNRIAEVRVSGAGSYTYTDTGNDLYAQDGNTSAPVSADSSYCYRVMTRGQYAEARLSLFGVLENYSQIQCATPTDTTRPCAPRLGLDSLNCANLTSESFCDQSTFTNKLRWQPTSGPSCDPNIATYNIYYGRYGDEDPTKLTSVNAPTTTFDHTSLTTVSGCYYVTAVSRRGLESPPSNRVCNDACPSFMLPNVFTPNGDGKNDVFQPMRCPRFVENIAYVIYNRWGTKVFEGNGPTLAWDGRTSDGAELPSGLYYYQINVRFSTLDRSGLPQSFKGWVQILREGVSMR